MPVYHFHSVMGQLPIVPGYHLESSDDAAAIERIRRGHEPVDCELWCGERKVAVIPKDAPPPSQA